MSADLADVFRLHGDSYRKTHKLPLNQLRTMHAIEICRTKELGGHIDECEDCGHLRISYNSCRNRHCPKCQFLRKEKWLEERGRELLPIPYFHVVFTVPEEINPLALRNQDVVYTILFKAASETLMELTRTRLGAQIGVIAVLHTWGQNLMDHPHLHCIVSGGGLSPETMEILKEEVLPAGKSDVTPLQREVPLLFTQGLQSKEASLPRDDCSRAGGGSVHGVSRRTLPAGMGGLLQAPFLRSRIGDPVSGTLYPPGRPYQSSPCQHRGREGLLLLEELC